MFEVFSFFKKMKHVEKCEKNWKNWKNERIFVFFHIYGSDPGKNCGMWKVAFFTVPTRVGTGRNHNFLAILKSQKRSVTRVFLRKECSTEKRK